MSPTHFKTSAYERAVLKRCDLSLEDGLALLDHLRRKQTTGFEETFPLAHLNNDDETAVGFFDHARIRNRRTPLLGIVQTMLFDRFKLQDGKVDLDTLCNQVRAFVLHYFMRISAWRMPQSNPDGEPLPESLKAPARGGFRYSQLFYKTEPDDKLGAFPPDVRSRVDLTQLYERYRWMVLKTNVYNFKLSLNLIPGTETVLQAPYDVQSYLVTSRDFLEEARHPTPDLAGRYGFGYAFIQDPRMGFLNYGPGRFEMGVQTFRFDVTLDGAVVVEMALVSSKPERFFNANPVDFGLEAADTFSFGFTKPFSRLVRRMAPVRMMDFDPVVDPIRAANLFGGGIPGRHFGLSERELMKAILFKHFQQHHQTMSGARQTWRRIANWCNEAALPEWVVQGADV